MLAHFATISIRPASVADIGHLVELMGEFYAESRYPFDSRRSVEAFRELIRHERLGRVWLIQNDGADVGYFVVTIGYSMEYGGLDAFLDDLFVRPAFRKAGLGTRAVREAREYCISRGVRALHLEAEKESAAALGLYRNAGFEGSGRELLTLRLSAATHAS